MQIALKNYQKLLSQIQKSIAQAEQNFVQNLNHEKLVLSWKIGKEIDEHLLDLEKNNDSKYGKKLLEQLETDTGIVARTLYQMRSFYKTYPVLPSEEKVLSWSHYRNLVTVKDETKRQLLEDLTVQKNLGANDLQQEISKTNAQEKKSSKKLRRKKDAEDLVKLKVTRGRIFAYKIVALGELKEIFVDLGFNVFSKLKTAFADQTIVECKKINDEISLKKSGAKSTSLHTYKAELEKVVDGDTIRVILDLGFKTKHREILRLTQINAAEASTKEGKKATEGLKKILQDVPFFVVKTNKADIYGRYLADVFFSENGETDLQKIADSGTYLSQLLIDRGLVEKY